MCKETIFLIENKIFIWSWETKLENTHAHIHTGIYTCAHGLQSHTLLDRNPAYTTQLGETQYS